MFTSKSFWCLDLGAGSVKAAEFAINEGGGLSLKQYGNRALGLDGAQESRREKAVLAAVRELMDARGMNARQASVCAPGFQVFSKFVKLPPVDAGKVAQIIQYEARQNIPFPLEEAVWDYQVMGATPSGEMEILLVAIRAEVVEGLFRVSEAAGLRTELVDASPAALCNAFRYNYGDLEGCTMLLDMGAKTSNLLFFEKGKVFARSINIGANAITQDFVAEARLPFAKAEEIKVAEGFVSLGGAYEEPENPRQATVAKIARQVLTRLHIQVNQTIQFYRGQQGGSAPTRLFLAGGASIMPYTAQFFAEKLNVAVEYFNPFRNVTIEPGVDVEELAKVAHGFGEVVGLALRNLAQCPVELNLVPKSIRSKQALQQKRPYFAAALASLTLVVFAVGVFYQNVAEIKRGSLAELNTSLTPLKARAEEMDQQVKKIKHAQDEMDVVTGYLQDRFFWPEALQEMRNLLVRVEERVAKPGQDVGVWIENFGTVAEDEVVEDEAPPTPAGGTGMDHILRMPPEMIKRYYPALYEMMKQTGMLAALEKNRLGASTDNFVSAVKPPVSTNLYTINVKFRAVNLSNANDPSANGRLAFAVAEEFKKCGIFDAAGTKLSGDLEEPDLPGGAARTFRFGMTLKLKNQMQL